MLFIGSMIFCFNFNFNANKGLKSLIYLGLVTAIGIESSGLHQKIALKIIMLFGSDPKWYQSLIFKTSLLKF